MNLKYISLWLLASSPVVFSQQNKPIGDVSNAVEAATKVVDEAVDKAADGAVEAVGDALKGTEPKITDSDVPVLVKIIKSEDTETADEGIHLQVDQFPDEEGDAKKGTQEARITAPWPAKPDQNIPQGWKLIPAPESLNDYKISVNLEDGQTVHLTMTPFVLAPEKGVSVVAAVIEPGFDPAQFDQQEKTMGALLGSATIQLEQKEKQAATVIDQLQQLLSSLPK